MDDNDDTTAPAPLDERVSVMLDEWHAAAERAVAAGLTVGDVATAHLAMVAASAELGILKVAEPERISGGIPESEWASEMRAAGDEREYDLDLSGDRDG